MLRLDPTPRDDRPPVACLCANTAWYIVNFRSRLIGTLQAQGWRVVVIAPDGAAVERLRALGVEHVPLALDNAGTNPLRELATLLRIRRLLARVGADVALTWTPKVNLYVSLAARTLRVPVLANISGLGSASAGGWLARVVRVLYRVALAWPSTVFFQNDEDRDAFVREGLVEAHRARRLPGSGVDVDRFAPPEAPAGAPERVPRFVLVARLLWDKGVGEFVEAARRVRAVRPDAEFALVGFVDEGHPSGVPRATIERWVADGVVDYLGSFDDMVPVYAGADCVVLPSYYREGVPRSLLEAASMGRVVITTDSVGCRETVEDGVTGWLVPPRDAAALADRMLRLLATDPAARARMGRAARTRTCAMFDERIVLSAYRRALEAIAPRTAGPTRVARAPARCD
jgi:glycosyltransferase involved in cell wall biosynthesis